MGYLLLEYQLSHDFLERRGSVREQHLAVLQAAADRGELVLAGALAEPADRSVLVFATDDVSVVERVVREDPYLEEGLVTAWSVRPWTVVVGSALPDAGP